jgi:exonuclease SbcC
MTGYPKIHSVSTVGVRQHDNVDFKLHEVRTDFTGDNGLGKSIIADLLQLIFIPLRSEWKPGTEGIDDREIEDIPLQKDWIKHAYAFLNIEKTQGKFLTIGVYIPRTSRLPVRPFIIQGGEDFESKVAKLLPFERILEATDFIAENLHIYDLIELKRNLFIKYKIHFKDFHNDNQIKVYFELLFKNQLLPIDLTHEANLKSFAKVLQSFSRAKTLDVKKSKSLQDFLFEDNDAIKASFDEQKEVLSQHIKNYHAADNEIRTLKRKQQKLQHLENTHTHYLQTKEEYLAKNAHLFLLKMNAASKIYSENEAKLTKSLELHNTLKKDYEKQCVESYRKMILQRNICVLIRNRLEEEHAGSGKHNLEKLKKKLFVDSGVVGKIEELQEMVNEAKSIDRLQHLFQFQEQKKEEKKKLIALINLSDYDQFKKSKWVDNFTLAYKFYNTRSQELDSRKKALEEILGLYDGNNPDSIFNWAVNRNKELSLEEETILVRFKEVYTRQINSTEGKLFTINPETLLTSYEKEGDGVWVKLGALNEYLPFVTRRVFNNKATLAAAVQEDRAKIQEEIRILEIERTSISKLNDALFQIGYNESYCELYKDKSQVEVYQINKKLNEENVAFITENFNLFSQLLELKDQLKDLDKKIEDIIGKTKETEAELRANGVVLTELLNEYLNDLKPEIVDPFDKTDDDIERLSTKQLIEMRDDMKSDIKAAEKLRKSTRTERDEQKNIHNLCSAKSTGLLFDKQAAEKAFVDAKQSLEEETEIRFESLLTLGDVTEEIVSGRKTTFETTQRAYELEYTSVANSFEESKIDTKNPELYNGDGIPYYSFQTLLNVLCGKIGLEGLTTELSQLNEHLKSLGELQLKILEEVFNEVEKQYNDYFKTVLSLNFFFDKNKVSDLYKFKVEFEPRRDINIDWIQRMKDKARVHKYGVDLFTNSDDMPSDQNTPENLIKNIARQFYSSVDADPYKLLDPKFYFTLKVRMEDDEGEKNTGSGGQAYTALALLCIGRLSIVQKDQERNKGVKFIIIEELSNIDDTNFNIFPDIAKKFGYQLITMTPKPFGSYNDEEWFLHMLVKNTKDKHRNNTPMSFFKTRHRRVDLDKHLQKTNELASI